MSSDTSTIGQLQIIVDDAVGRRLADRFVRVGLPVALVPHLSLDNLLRGAVYAMAGARVATIDLHLITRAGAHLLLLPPFPEQFVVLAGDLVTFAPAGRRGGVHLSQLLVEGTGSLVTPDRMLHILYRDRIAGGFSIGLAETGEGEVLAAALPRASNLHGQVIITTLMLGTASAQTAPDDVATLVHSLVSWCTATEVAPADKPVITQQQVSQILASEHDAQIVLLAIALVIAGSPSEVTDKPMTTDTIQPMFERVAALLGEVPDKNLLARGWDWLRTHGVLTNVQAGMDDTARAESAMMRKFIQMWQLHSRLRRLASRLSSR